MQPGHRQQGRHGRVVLVHATVGEDEDVDIVFLHHLAREVAQLLHRLAQTLFAAGNAEQGGQHADFEARQIHAPDLGEFFVRQDRPLDLQPPAVRRLRLQQIPLGAQARLGGGDDLLADAVDRRVGHLREQLLEVIIEQPRLVREHGERGVIAHRAQRFDAVARHRQDQHALVFERITKRYLALAQRVRIGRGHLGRRRQVVHVNDVLVEPLPVRPLGDQGLLDLLVFDDAALRRIHHEHAAGLEPAFLHDVTGGNIEHTRFRGHHHKAVLGHVIARRAEPVAVQNRTHLNAVSERDRGRAIPRLHQAGMEFVEGLPLRVHAFVIRPRLGNHHHHRVRQRPTREHEQFERVVEHRRVRAMRVDDRHHFLDVVTKRVRDEAGLAGVHPVDVAPKRVDLAIVRDEPIGMRPVPTGKGVRAEARVHQAQRRLKGRIQQVGKIFLQLHGQQHALVDHRSRRETANIPVGGPVDRGAADLVEGALADDVELALESEVVRDRRIAADEGLPH